MPESYMRTTGPTPLDHIDLDTKKGVIDMLKLIALMRLLLAHGGSFVVDGLGTPEGVQEYITKFEIGMRGLGDGRVELMLVKKPLPDVTADD